MRTDVRITYLTLVHNRYLY